MLCWLNGTRNAMPALPRVKNNMPAPPDTTCQLQSKTAHGPFAYPSSSARDDRRRETGTAGISEKPSTHHGHDGLFYLSWRRRRREKAVA